MVRKERERIVAIWWKTWKSDDAGEVSVWVGGVWIGLFRSGVEGVSRFTVTISGSAFTRWRHERKKRTPKNSMVNTDAPALYQRDRTP